MTGYYIGLDIGTSGCRACAIDKAGELLAQTDAPLPASRVAGTHCEQLPAAWWHAVTQVLSEIAERLGPAAKALAVDGTSGTLVLTDAAGQPLAPALMYNDSRASDQAARIRELAPATSGAHGATSGAAKWLWLHEQQTFPAPPAHVLSQADWLVGRLTGAFGISDENNALKFGYDPINRHWPGWLAALGLPTACLPRVLPPGSPYRPLATRVAAGLGLAPATKVVTGTTDSIAAFLATGADHSGDAVTSLGSTLALKVLTEQPLYAPDYGIYSHRLGARWLAGGASNCGGQVLKQFFTQAELDRMTPLLRPDQPTGLDYYPLSGVGERFPVANAQLTARLTPRPAAEVDFFQGILEGLARVEAEGYARLQALGAAAPRRVFSVGGGAANPAFMQIRARALGVETLPPRHSEAAYGAALLAARRGYAYERSA